MHYNGCLTSGKKIDGSDTTLPLTRTFSMTGQGRTGQDRARQDRTGQDRTGRVGEKPGGRENTWNADELLRSR